MLNYEFKNEEAKTLEQISILMDKIFYFVKRSNPANQNYINDISMKVFRFYEKQFKFQIDFNIYNSNNEISKSFRLNISNNKDKKDKEFIRILLNYPKHTPMCFAHSEYINLDISYCFYTITEIILDQLKKLKIIE